MNNITGANDATSQTPAQNVGVVVIGRNEGERLSNCINSLADHLPLIVYVDSGSTDGSVAVVSDRGAKVVNLSRDLPFTAARARNAGFDELTKRYPNTRYVQFVDGDCEIASGWIAAAVTFLEEHANVAIVCGRRRERFPQYSVYNALCDAEWNTPIGSADACGGDFLARTDAFSQVGGFTAKLIAGEEPELCIRLRSNSWVIWRMDHEMTLHDANITTLGQWWQRTKRAGHAFAEVERIHRGSPHGLWKRNVFRILLWGGLLPLAVLASAFVGPWALALLLFYPMQLARLVARCGRPSAFGVKRAFLLVLGKFAELQGLLAYYVSAITKRDKRIIEYK